jgi:hypothetical protein
MPIEDLLHDAATLRGILRRNGQERLVPIVVRNVQASLLNAQADQTFGENQLGAVRAELKALEDAFRQHLQQFHNPEPVEGNIPTDSAMAGKTRGGIDLNARNMSMDVGGEKIDIHFDKAMIAQFRRGDFSGVRPVIMSITPLASIKPLLGIKDLP